MACAKHKTPMRNSGFAKRPKWLVRACMGVALAALCCGAPVHAQELASGHGPLEIWDADARANVPAWVRVWLRFMQITFLLGLVFVWRRVEARWVVGGFFAVFLSAVATQELTDIDPLSGLIATLHVVFWTPALYVLLARRPFAKERSIYAAWTGLITLVILFSFVFDVPYMAIYFDHVLGMGWFG